MLTYIINKQKLLFKLHNKKMLYLNKIKHTKYMVETLVDDDPILKTKEFTEITISDGKIHQIMLKENSIVRLKKKRS